MKISQYDHLALVIDKYQDPALGVTENHENSKIIQSSELLKKKSKTARVTLKKMLSLASTILFTY